MDPCEQALRMLTQTPHIREYLREHDPKALQQAEHALPLSQAESSNALMDEAMSRFTDLRERAMRIPSDEPVEQEVLLSILSLMREVERIAPAGDLRKQIMFEWCEANGYPYPAQKEAV